MTFTRTQTRDPLARAWVAAEAVRALARARRGVVACACGAEYAPTPDGQRRHQMLHGHRPARQEG